MTKQYFILILKAYDHRVLDNAVHQITDVVSRSGAEFVGPVPLPVRRKIFTVLRSPHVDKNSREHFVKSIYTRLIYVDSGLVEVLQNTLLPAGVEVKIKLREAK